MQAPGPQDFLHKNPPEFTVGLCNEQWKVGPPGCDPGGIYWQSLNKDPGSPISYSCATVSEVPTLVPRSCGPEIVSLEVRVLEQCSSGGCRGVRPTHQS